LSRALGARDNADIAARSRARDNDCGYRDVELGPTIVPSKRSFDRSLDRPNDQVSALINAVATKAGEPCAGPFEQRVRGAVDGLTELAPVIDKVRHAGNQLKLPMLVRLVEQVAGELRAPAEISSVAPRRDRPQCEACGGSGYSGFDDQGRAVRCRACNNPRTVAAG
jgi:hypothetical protein